MLILLYNYYIIAGKDFLNINFRVLTFAANISSGEQLCVVIHILDDSILEEVQTFFVLTRTHDFVNNIVNITTVSIVDDDCKLACGFRF